MIVIFGRLGYVFRCSVLRSLRLLALVRQLLFYYYCYLPPSSCVSFEFVVHSFYPLYSPFIDILYHCRRRGLYVHTLDARRRFLPFGVLCYACVLYTMQIYVIEPRPVLTPPPVIVISIMMIAACTRVMGWPGSGKPCKARPLSSFVQLESQRRRWQFGDLPQALIVPRDLVYYFAM